MTRLTAAAACAALAFASMANAQVVYTEDFNDGVAAGRWSAPIVDSELATAPFFDGTVDYAFDYGAVGLPEAPNSTGTDGIGMFMEVNTTDQGSVDEGEAVGVIASGLTLPAGSFTMSLDVYWNVEGGNSGSTEYGIFGIHTGPVNAPGDAAINDDVPLNTFGLSNGNGLSWEINGDAGASTRDIMRNEDPGNADTGERTIVGTFDDIDAGAIPGVSTGPNADGPQGAWVELEISRIGIVYSITMNGFELDSFRDFDGDFDGGSIMLGYNDPFNSVGFRDRPPLPDPFPDPPPPGPFGDDIEGPAHFILFDNVVITSVAPEPASALLVALGGLGLAARRRR